MKNKRVLGISVILLILFSLFYFSYRKSVKNRQLEIHERGSQVMPFNLDKTTHVFQRTDTGGLQRVLVKDNREKEQIALIQAHLKEEAERFSKGDFDDPVTLHGEDMPGLSVLKNAHGEYTAEYSSLPNGGQIVYTVNDKNVLEAFHMWFMAQLQDHGSDAMEHL